MLRIQILEDDYHELVDAGGLRGECRVGETLMSEEASCYDEEGTTIPKLNKNHVERKSAISIYLLSIDASLHSLLLELVWKWY